MLKTKHGAALGVFSVRVTFPGSGGVPTLTFREHRFLAEIGQKQGFPQKQVCPDKTSSIFDEFSPNLVAQPPKVLKFDWETAGGPQRPQKSDFEVPVKPLEK